MRKINIDGEDFEPIDINDKDALRVYKETRPDAKAAFYLRDVTEPKPEPKAFNKKSNSSALDLTELIGMI